MTISWALILVILATPWSIPLHGTPQHFAESFEPVGHFARADWTLKKTASGRVLEYHCEVRKGCTSHPTRARFYFTDSKLASAVLSFQKEHGPTEHSAASVILKTLGTLGPPVHETLQVGQRIQYFNRDGLTYVWLQDGPDAQVKMYVDAHDPVGVAEASALGASLSLDPFPGAQDFARGQTAVMKESWPAAIEAFRAVLSHPRAVLHLKEQTRQVLAMTLAAQVTMEKTTHSSQPGWSAQALKSIDEAVRLAPEMKGPFLQLKSEVTSLLSVEQSQ